MGWGEVRGRGGKSFAKKGTGNKTGTFYYNKMCLFANRSDPVLREKLIMGEQEEELFVEGKTWKGSGGWGQGRVKRRALEKQWGASFVVPEEGRVGAGTDGWVKLVVGRELFWSHQLPLESV